ncbi:hypothetical protein [Candidatus Arthromitus sp. SFB-rat-Yit]|uniref:hypothetical protein n=1 Tax=Candidatus Arthromitus sp. SFB-rat-Yit TaxID=1041504 RepID=UPI000227A1EA|nr:hypothetical protein [Candidatus Arthromitus sp. SFB-rat-Yit]BAK80767.1 hypothetical protein RATSFB_0205 [Candidatus Arthromitus sp. SFB-rat-Yit]
MEEIRYKYNKYIDNELKNKISNLKVDAFDFKDIKFTYNIRIYTVFEKLSEILPYEEEGIEFLDKMIGYIKSLDLNSVVKLCDDYEFRFFKLYDYLIDNLNQNFLNQALFNLFRDVLLNTKTINGVNLSLFILSIFNPEGLYEICFNDIQSNIDYLEIVPFLASDKNYFTNEYFFALNCFYQGKNINYILGEFKKNNIKSLNVLLFVFYLYGNDFHDFNNKNLIDFNVLNYLRLIRYKLNLNFKKSICVNRDRYFKIFKRVESSIESFKYLIRDKDIYHDIKYIHIYLKLFGKESNILNSDVQNFIKRELIDGIESFDVKKCKYIFEIYNILDINILNVIGDLFIKYYENLRFVNLIFRVIIEYKYAMHVIKYFEDTFYISKLIRDTKSITTVLRALILIYEKNVVDGETGLKIIKSLIVDKYLYVKYNEYIKYFVIKVIESR